MNTGIMSAMPEEMAGLLKTLENRRDTDYGMRTFHQGLLYGTPVVLVFSRWGKVAAATTATSLLAKFSCEKIVFTGVAGGVASDLKVGDVIIAEKLAQHDMDASPIFPEREIPLLGKTDFLADESMSHQLEVAVKEFFHEISKDIAPDLLGQFKITNPQCKRGYALSGDKFFSSTEDIVELRKRVAGASCVEMEGAAMAQVCHEHGVPFAVVRTISDSADDQATLDFQKFVRVIAAKYSESIIRRYLQKVVMP